MEDSNPKSKTWLIPLAWLFVGIPLAWGVYQTGYQSLALFRNTPAATTAPVNR